MAPQATYLQATDQLLEFPNDGQSLWNALDTGHRVRQNIRRYSMMTEATQISWLAGYLLLGRDNYVENGARSFVEHAGLDQSAESVEFMNHARAQVACTTVAYHAAHMLKGGKLISPPEITQRLKRDPVGHAILAAGCLVRDGDESARLTHAMENEVMRKGAIADPLKIHMVKVRGPYTSYNRLKKLFFECDLNWHPVAASNTDVIAHSPKVSHSVVEYLASELVGIGSIKHELATPATVFFDSRI